MSSFYADAPDLGFRLEHADLARVVRLREDDYSQASRYTYAPSDYEDAVDSFRRVLEIAGEIAGDFVAPRAEDVDRLGSELAGGEVCYAPGIAQALDRLRQADLMGMTLPRQFGGLNLPVTVAMMVTEMISRADPALMNVFGLQDIADTINKFASEELKREFLPRFASGEVTGSMALTEPEAGSDLQNVQLRATPLDDGTWRLDGVKRFITNGCGQVSLVLARSEEGTTDARGLSLFVYERDEHMKIRRLEDKLGIHGSPTCELQFTDAPARLVGERRRGLTTYVMSLMNGARLAIAAQAQGVAEAAWRAAEKYAGERVQFGKPIREITGVTAMLADMHVSLEASRALLYETAGIVDLKDALEHRREQLTQSELRAAGVVSAAGQAQTGIVAGVDLATASEGAESAAIDSEQSGVPAGDRLGSPQDTDPSALRTEIKKVGRLAALFTPLCKACATEMANGVTYDALQVHGGSGYMRDFAVERHARDARITNIYEGTTQLQVVAAIGGVLGGTLADQLGVYDGRNYAATPELLTAVRRSRQAFGAAVTHVKEAGDERFRDFHARRLVEMAIDLVCSYLLLGDAQHDARKLLVARHFIDGAGERIGGASMRIVESRPADLDELQVLGRL